jgi:hypothetical protein
MIGEIALCVGAVALTVRTGRGPVSAGHPGRHGGGFQSHEDCV